MAAITFISIPVPLLCIFWIPQLWSTNLREQPTSFGSSKLPNFSLNMMPNLQPLYVMTYRKKSAICIAYIWF